MGMIDRRLFGNGNPRRCQHGIDVRPIIANAVRGDRLLIKVNTPTPVALGNLQLAHNPDYPVLDVSSMRV